MVTTMKAALGLSDPLLPFKYHLIFTGAPIITALSGAGIDSDTLSFRVQGFALPGFTTEQIVVQYTDSKLAYNGRTQLTSNEWQCQLIEGREVKIHKAIYLWMRANHETMDASGRLSQDCKAVCKAQTYNMHNDIEQTFTMTGIFPLELPNITFTADYEAQPIVHDIKFSVDDVRPEF